MQCFRAQVYPLSCLADLPAVLFQGLGQELLEDVPGIQLPLAKTNYAENHYWCFPILFRSRSPDWLMRQLNLEHIQTRHFFFPLHQQPCFDSKFEESFPVAERLWESGIYLPSGPDITDKEIKTVCSTLEGLL